MCAQGKGSEKVCERRCPRGPVPESLETHSLGRIMEFSGLGSRWSDGSTHQNSKTRSPRLALRGLPVLLCPRCGCGRTG